jgi:hypothetical protein
LPRQILSQWFPFLHYPDRQFAQTANPNPIAANINYKAGCQAGMFDPGIAENLEKSRHIILISFYENKNYKNNMLSSFVMLIINSNIWAGKGNTFQKDLFAIRNGWQQP